MHQRAAAQSAPREAALHFNPIMTITRINTFEAKSGQGADLREFLSSIIALIIEAPGCRSVELLVGHDDSGRFAILEIWETIEAHKASASRIPPKLFQIVSDVP